LSTNIETQSLDERLRHSYILVGRLKPGISLAQANAEARGIGVHLEKDFSEWRRGWAIKLLPLRQEILGDINGKMRLVIYLLVFVVCFLLLITCVNVANLLLVRSLERNHEVAVQVALGASRKRLVSQLLSESVILALAGGVVGLVLASMGTKLFASFKVTQGMDMKAMLDHADLDGTVLLFTFAVSLVTGLLFGLAPMRQILLPGALAQGLRGGQRAGMGVAGKRLLNVLMVGEIIMATVLLIGAGLMIRNFQQLNDTKLGFRKDRLLSTTLYLSPEDYPTYQQRTDFVKRLVEYVRTRPGVLSAGVTTNLPLDEPSLDAGYTIEGKPPADSSEVPITSDRVVTPGYLEMMNIVLLRGRFLSDQDRADTVPVVVVTREFARHAWGDEDPIGKRLKIGYPPKPTSPWYTVVGMVDNVKEDRWSFEIDRASWYMSYAQRDVNLFPVRLLVLSNGDPASLTSEVRNAVWTINKNQPVGEAVTMENFVADFLGPQQFTAVLGSIFAGIGLILAVVGIYSVTSYSVTRRTREFGIRVALGAQRKDVVRLVLTDGLRLASLGLGVGLLFGFILSRVISSVLFQVGPATPQLLGGGAACLAIVAMAAMYIPVRRAMKVDPNKTLRYE
jgi:putative ABC transport system permease protein